MRFEFVNDLHRAHLGSARNGSRGQAGHQRVKRIAVLIELPRHCRRNMHHVRISFNHHHVRQLDRSISGNSTDIVATQIHQHYMFGSFFFIGQQILFKGDVLLFGFASAAGPGQRTYGHFSIHDTAHDFRRATH